MTEQRPAALAEFNAAPAPQARELVLACAHVDAWADEIVAGRPYGSVADAVGAVRSSRQWTDEEVDAALARHPRIGERPAGRDTGAVMSRSEQAGVDAHDADVRRRLREGNAAYEQRFGHVFLIRAAGRDAEEILAALDERLTHTPEQERRIAAEQLREIAALRLETALRTEGAS